MSENMWFLLYITGMVMSYWTFLLSYKDLFGKEFIHPFEPIMGMFMCGLMSWAAMFTLFIAWIVVRIMRICKNE